MLREIARGLPVVHDVGENGLQHDHRGLGSVDVHDHFRAVIIQQRQGFFFLGIEPPPDHLLVRVVEAVVFQRPFFEAVHHFVPVGAAQMEHPPDVDGIGHELGLPGVAGNPIED